MLENLEADLQGTRERLLRRALDPGSFIGLIELQVELAESIMRSEVARRRLPKQSDERALWKYHDQQLRVVGDTLAWLALDSHTIRNLGKDPGRPASLSGQWSDFQFVLQTARRIAGVGLVVLVCDVTNVLLVGDLVVRFESGELDVIECKNVDSETLLRRKDPRVSRQISRGQRLASYLTTGEATFIEVDPPPSEGYEAVQQAIGISYEAIHDWTLLLKAIEEVSEIGTGLARKSSEFVLVQRHDASFSPDVVFPRLEGTESKEILLIAFAADIIDNPSPLHAPVTYWPIPLEHRLAIWERRLYVGHGIGEGDIVGSLSDDPHIAITKVERDGRLHVHVQDQHYILGDRFVDNVLVDFQTVDSMREQALRFAAACSNPGVAPSTSPSVAYGLITPEEPL
jgi:hypothetical protein